MTVHWWRATFPKSSGEWICTKMFSTANYCPHHTSRSKVYREASAPLNAQRSSLPPGLCLLAVPGLAGQRKSRLHRLDKPHWYIHIGASRRKHRCISMAGIPVLFILTNGIRGDFWGRQTTAKLSYWFIFRKLLSNQNWEHQIPRNLDSWLGSDNTVMVLINYSQDLVLLGGLSKILDWLMVEPPWQRASLVCTR